MNTTIQSDHYASYKRKQMRLAAMLNKSSEIISVLEMNHCTKLLKRLGGKVHNDAFKIQVVGTFKNGKSTFINSFLGDEILPAYALPCTAVINEVKYREEKKAVLYFKNPLPENLPEELSEKSVLHMQKYSMENVPPMEIPYDEIEDYVVIPIGKEPKDMLLESPYEKVELFWPLELLKNGVSIIDSPGLNEHATRTRVTMDYLSKADAILFVLSATSLCSQEEMSFIENNLTSHGFEDPFFVINRFDLIPESERPKIVDYAKRKLTKHTSFGEKGLFFVSARDALDGKIENDAELLQSSGMPVFEEKLSEFLTKHKGKAKLSQPARELKRILNDEALYKVLPRQRNMINSSIDEIKRKYNDANPVLENLKVRKNQLYTRVMNRIEQLKPDFHRLVNRNILSMIDVVPGWVNEYKPKTELGIFPSKEKISAMTTEILEYVTQQIEITQTAWKNEILLPEIEKKISDVFNYIENDLNVIFDEIDNIQYNVSSEEDKMYDKSSTWKRISGNVDEFTSIETNEISTDGLDELSKELAASMAVNMGASMLLSALGMVNPVTMIAVLAGNVIIGANQSKTKSSDEVKNAISAKISERISESAEKNATSFADEIHSKFKEIINRITDSVDIEINETDNRIKKIITEMEKGAANIQAKNRMLDNCEKNIKILSKELDKFIFELMD